jgi:putative membrane protein
MGPERNLIITIIIPWYAQGQVVEITMIPNIDNEEVRALFKQGLEIFKAHEKHAEMMIKSLQ